MAAARGGPHIQTRTDLTHPARPIAHLDARHLRELLQAGRLPESSIPSGPSLICALRSSLRKALRPPSGQLKIVTASPTVKTVRGAAATAGRGVRARFVNLF
jgi:hypothetical protein